MYSCQTGAVAASAETDSSALVLLNKAVAGCLARKGLKPVEVNLQFTASTSEGHSSDVQGCISSARRAQLAPYVAPAARLYINSSSTITPSRFTLSRSNVRRIVLVTSLVLLLTMALTALVGLRLVRPLRALIRSLQQPISQNIRVPVRTNDEIGSLATAFNDLADRRERLETQRKAMISDIAHELRTPLSNVRGWLQAAEDNITARDQALTASLLEEALHLQRIIDDLQDLAQADAGELRLDRQEVQLGELLALIAHTHRGQGDVAGVTLLSDAPTGLNLDADPTRLRQAIGNLVSNAIRHTPDGGTVTLRGYRNGPDVRIDVIDTGSGIGAEDLPQVFDRFWRADKSRSRASGGSGLGLAITRQLIQAHGGDISVTSTPGQETVFRIQLPASVVSARTPGGRRG